MLQLINNTPFRAERAVLVDNEGNQVWVVIVKATYLLNEDGSVDQHPQPEPVCLFPLYSGELGRSSLLREGEVVCDHPGTDITLLATAHAPNERPVRRLDVSASVGPIVKTLRIFGERHWQGSVFAPKITDPEPFVKQPINYERAYGGTNILSDKPDQQEKEPRNPIGRGFASSVNTLIGKQLPNIEDPDQLIQAWNDRPRPVGYGPIPGMWCPRLEYAGTFDARWQELRMPLWPEDHNPRYSQAAHPDLVSQQPLRGGEQVVLTNLTPGSVLSFLLPRAYIIFTTSTRTGSLRQRVQLDRVIIEPDAKKLVMVWRSSLHCGARVRNIVSTAVELKPYLQRKPVSTERPSN
jgi:hypothetical protein